MQDKESSHGVSTYPKRLQFPVSSSSMSQAYICIPWRLGVDTMVYNVDSILSYDDDYFAPAGNQTFIMGFRFSFFESENKGELVEEALTSLEHFRQYGPSQEDLTVVARDYQPTNKTLSEKLIDALLSPLYNGNLAEAFKVREDLISELRTLDTVSWSREIHRLMPDNLRERNVIAVVSPRAG